MAPEYLALHNPCSYLAILEESEILFPNNFGGKTKQEWYWHGLMHVLPKKLLLSTLVKDEASNLPGQGRGLTFGFGGRVHPSQTHGHEEREVPKGETSSVSGKGERSTPDTHPHGGPSQTPVE